MYVTSQAYNELYIDPFLPKDGRHFVNTVSIKSRINNFCLHAKPFVLLCNMAVVLRMKMIYLHPNLSVMKFGVQDLNRDIY